MKCKTEARREAILDVAAQAFRELGFEGTSMSEIRARLGGSKATLYNYFASKEELFYEVMARASEAEFDAAHRAIDATQADIGEALRHFGERLLGVLYSPEIRASRHLAIASAGRNELGRLVYERGVLNSQRLVADFLAGAMAEGRLRRADPRIAAQHLHALLEAELIDRFLFQLLEALDGTEIAAVTARAVDVFMAAYGPLAESAPGTAG